MSVEALNEQFAIAGQLRFVDGKGGDPWIEVDNGQARAVISVYAGQVLSYQPAGEPEDLLFMGGKAYFQPGKAIKGGIPVCWPWFGADPEGKGRPAHGFVRNRLWSVVSTGSLDDGSTRVVLGLTDSPDTRALWPHAFELNIEITVGRELGLALVTRNAGSEPLVITQALHTYFRVGDINQVSVTGLEGKEYLDKAKAATDPRRTQSGAVTVGQEVDRIYLDVGSEQVIEDAGFHRRIRINTSGNHTAVVWNPWIDIAKAMGDLDDDDYLRFICAETTNAADDRVTVNGGQEYRLTARYRVERDG